MNSNMESGNMVSGKSPVEKYRAVCREAEQEYEHEKDKLWKVYKDKLRKAYGEYLESK